MSSIRWSKQDLITLDRTINNFNQKIKRLQKLDKSLNLPSIENYFTAKQSIATRNELNKYINSLKRFTSRGGEVDYVQKEENIARRNALLSIQGKMRSLEKKAPRK